MKRTISFQLLVFIGVSVLMLPMTYTQNTLKRQEQAAHYLYLSANLALEYNDETSEIELADRNPASQLTVQYLFKNLNKMHRSRTIWPLLDQIKFKVSGQYLPTLTEELVNPVTNETYTVSETNFNVGLKELSAKFGTMWDRTSFVIGYFGLPYGQSRKMQNEFGLIPSIASTDIKFSSDLGIRFNFPLHEYVDASVSLTSGGIISGPLMNFSFVDEGLVNYGLVSPSNYSYDGNWLLTANVGTPKFSSTEFGATVAMGNIQSSLNGIASDANVFRVVPYLILKNKERMVFNNQLSFGFINYSFAKTQSVNMINQFEYMTTGNSSFFLFSRISSVWDREVNTTKQDLGAGFTYTIIPRVKVRVNGIYNLNYKTDDSNLYWFVQLIAGFGQNG